MSEVLQQLNFQPSQIVFLEHDTSRLYAEVIQFVESRQLCWVRPIALVTASGHQDWADYDRLTLQNLQDGSDLMCPAALFREALDLEVLPLFDLFCLSTEIKPNQPSAHRDLRRFIHQVWEAHPEQFER